MRFPGLVPPNPLQTQGDGNSSRILPPDPKAPERPTIPPPTCGTLPPPVPSLPDLLGGGRRGGR